MRKPSAIALLRSTILVALGGELAACGRDLANGAGGGDAGAEDAPTRSAFSCGSPVPLVVQGTDTGFDTCDGGSLRRREKRDCPSVAPRADAGAGCVLERTCTCADAGPDGGTACVCEGFGTCVADSDCTEKPLGFCRSGLYPGCTCAYGCTRDSDCSTGELCECGELTGTCVPARCLDGTSCPAGDCVTSAPPGACSQTTFACQTPADRCLANADCSVGTDVGTCTFDEEAGNRLCGPTTICAGGRPFFVEGEMRVAPESARRDWSLPIVPDTTGMPASRRARLAKHWAEVARLEHASIASFARVSLDLLSLGAPPALLETTARALADEIEHARLVFGLAEAYGEEPLGPGPLAVDGALERLSLAEFARRTAREGCVGETLAALEAQVAADQATDPAVRDLLARIAEDEGRHAALAWQTVAWAIAEGGEPIAGIVERELDVAFVETLSRLEEAESAEDLGQHGVLGLREQRSLVEASRGSLIEPCMRACRVGLTTPGRRAVAPEPRS